MEGCTLDAKAVKDRLESCRKRGRKLEDEVAVLVVV